MVGWDWEPRGDASESGWMMVLSAGEDPGVSLPGNRHALAAGAGG